jgi:hypothetical protein
MMSRTAVTTLCAVVCLSAPVLQAQVTASAIGVKNPSAVVPAARVDSMSRNDQLGYRREVFTYDAAGRRDPFVSLAATGVLRPTIADLTLTGIAYASRGGGGQSVAIFRDKQTKEQYRVRVGQPLGRMRVASIEPRRVVFSIDEFGVSRQESIAMGDSTRTITPTRAP